MTEDNNVAICIFYPFCLYHKTTIQNEYANKNKKRKLPDSYNAWQILWFYKKKDIKNAKKYI